MLNTNIQYINEKSNNTDYINVLSLGWGVQSVALALMAVNGELGRIDFAIFADTNFENEKTKEYIKKYKLYFICKGLRIVTVKNNGSNHQIYKKINKGFQVQIPAFTFNKENNVNGQIRRQCTYYWKIAPIRRYLQSIRSGKKINMFLGISLDEFLRMKDSNVKYINNVYPLVENRLSRNDCVNYIKKNNLDIPSKSSCWFCPFKSLSEWRNSSDKEFQKAISLEKQIKNLKPPYDLYLTNKRKNLNEIDFRSQEQKGQLSLFDNECLGICGI